MIRGGGVRLSWPARFVYTKPSEAFLGTKGACVNGRKLLRLRCYELGLTQPRMNDAERKLGHIPTHDDLLNEVALQVKTIRWHQ